MQTDKIRQLIQQLEHFMSLYGYEIKDIPIIDDAGLFLTKAGDQIVERLFIFERRGQQLALRPEFTASATEQFVNLSPNEIVRWQFNGLIFEDQRHQQRNNYQRYSFGAELFGIGNVYADAEIISMATKGIMNAGVKDWQLSIGHVGLMRQLLSTCGLDDRTLRFLLNYRHALKESGKEYVLEQLEHYLPSSKTPPQQTTPIITTIDEANAHQMVDTFLEASRGRDTMGGRSRNDISRRILKKRQQSAQHSQIINAIEFLERWTRLEGSIHDIFPELEKIVNEYVNDKHGKYLLDELHTLTELLDFYGIPSENLILKPDIAREWEYYTGAVFEIRSTDSKLLCGGGRYDDLTRLIGGKDDAPAIGFAYNLENIIEYIEYKNEDTIFEFHFRETQIQIVIGWANILREKGIRVALIPVADTTQQNTLNNLSVNQANDLVFRGVAYQTSNTQELIEQMLRGSLDVSR